MYRKTLLVCVLAVPLGACSVAWSSRTTTSGGLGPNSPLGPGQYHCNRNLQPAEPGEGICTRQVSELGEDIIAYTAEAK
jgi:hypothetical protein